MREQTLEKRARDVIVQQIMDSGDIEVEEIMDLIRPHYLFDPQKAREQAIRRKAHQLAAQIRDENGVRTVFACKDNGVSKYVNIDLSEDLPSLKSVEAQLWEKANGNKTSAAKASHRRMEVEGQLSLDLERLI